MHTFNAENLESLATERGMVFPPHVVAQVVAALDAGKHVVLTGAPGTGKTTLAISRPSWGNRR